MHTKFKKALRAGKIMRHCQGYSLEKWCCFTTKTMDNISEKDYTIAKHNGTCKSKRHHFNSPPRRDTIWWRVQYWSENTKAKTVPVMSDWFIPQSKFQENVQHMPFENSIWNFILFTFLMSPGGINLYRRPWYFTGILLIHPWIKVIPW